MCTTPGHETLLIFKTLKLKNATGINEYSDWLYFLYKTIKMFIIIHIIISSVYLKNVVLLLF